MPYTGAMWLLDEFYAKNQVLSSLLLKESYNFAIDNDTCAMDGTQSTAFFFTSIRTCFNITIP
jgi:hypothetical protein